MPRMGQALQGPPHFVNITYEVLLPICFRSVQLRGAHTAKVNSQRADTDGAVRLRHTRQEPEVTPPRDGFRKLNTQRGRRDSLSEVRRPLKPRQSAGLSPNPQSKARGSACSLLSARASSRSLSRTEFSFHAISASFDAYRTSRPLSLKISASPTTSS